MEIDKIKKVKENSEWITCTNCENLIQVTPIEINAVKYKCPFCGKKVQPNNKFHKVFINLVRIIISFIVGTVIWYFIKIGLKILDQYLGKN